MNSEVICLEETTSTNDYLQQLLCREEVEEGTLIRTKLQTSGRGQSSNKWESEKDANLTFSMVLYPGFLPVAEQFLLSQVTALGVVDFLTTFCGLKDLSVKWPNDIYWRDKKICGMLIENLLTGHTISHTILGVGININQQAFRSDAPNPVSASQITGAKYDLDDAARHARRTILNRYLQLLREDKATIRKDYLNALYRGKGYFRYQDPAGQFMARIKDVQDTGILVLETEKGQERAYAFKEVTFII